MKNARRASRFCNHPGVNDTFFATTAVVLPVLVLPLAFGRDRLLVTRFPMWRVWGSGIVALNLAATLGSVFGLAWPTVWTRGERGLAIAAVVASVGAAAGALIGQLWLDNDS